jgi:hypothetical protein
MRAAKIAGIVVLAIWMVWITIRVEASYRAAMDACTFAYDAAEHVGALQGPVTSSCIITLHRQALSK